jgi:hypothetical protein
LDNDRKDYENRSKERRVTEVKTSTFKVTTDSGVGYASVPSTWTDAEFIKYYAKDGRKFVKAEPVQEGDMEAQVGRKRRAPAVEASEPNHFTPMHRYGYAAFVNGKPVGTIQSTPAEARAQVPFGVPYGKVKIHQVKQKNL